MHRDIQPGSLQPRGLGVRAGRSGDAMRRLAFDDLAQHTPDDSLVLVFTGMEACTRPTSAHAREDGLRDPVNAAHSGRHMAAWLRIDSWLSDVVRSPPHILVIIDSSNELYGFSEFLVDMHRGEFA